jgi:hypothetical protein
MKYKTLCQFTQNTVFRAATSGALQADRNAQKEHTDPSPGSILKIEAPPQNFGTQPKEHMAPKIKYG